MGIYNKLIISGADTGSSENLTCHEDTAGRHEGAFCIGTLAIAGLRQGSAVNQFCPSSISSRCGRLSCACTAYLVERRRKILI